MENRIRGWLPKEPLLTSFQAKSRALILFMMIFLAILVVPLFFLTLEVRALLGEGFVILVIAVSVIFGYVTRKKGWYKPLPKVRRIHIIVCSGLFTCLRGWNELKGYCRSASVLLLGSFCHVNCCWSIYRRPNLEKASDEQLKR